MAVADAAIGKLMRRGHDNDLRWVRAGLIEGILYADTIRARSRKVPSGTAEEIDCLLAHLDRTESRRGTNKDRSDP
ncbi:MAG: hypothetical protein ABI212_02135 [Burkholderiaceae bacterium]